MNGGARCVDDRECGLQQESPTPGCGVRKRRLKKQEEPEKQEEEKRG